MFELINSIIPSIVIVSGIITISAGIFTILDRLKNKKYKYLPIFAIIFLILFLLTGLIWISKSNSENNKFIIASNPNEIQKNLPSLVKEIMRIKKTTDLLIYLNILVKKGDIAVGNYSDFGDGGNNKLFVIVVDSTHVLNIFMYHNFTFYDLNLSFSYKEIRNHYLNKTQIWMLCFSE